MLVKWTDFLKTDEKKVFSGINNLSYYPDDYVVIAARPSIGKTSMAISLAEKQLNNNMKVGFISLEMSKKLILKRFYELKNTFFIEDLFESLKQIDLFSKNLLLEAPKSNKISELSKTIKVMKDNKVEIVYIDYIGLISAEDSYIPKRDQVSKISKKLKELSKLYQIPIVVISQLNRSAEKEAPTLADIRDSGAIEEDADIIFFLNRDRSGNFDNNAYLHLAKNRNGRVVEKIRFSFLANKTRFIEKDEVIFYE